MRFSYESEWMKTETAWRRSMLISYIEFNKNMEKGLHLFLTWISIAENRKCLGRFGVEFQNFRRYHCVAGGQMDTSYKQQSPFHVKKRTFAYIRYADLIFYTITVCQYGSRM